MGIFNQSSCSSWQWANILWAGLLLITGQRSQAAATSPDTLRHVSTDTYPFEPAAHSRNPSAVSQRRQPSMLSRKLAMAAGETPYLDPLLPQTSTSLEVSTIPSQWAATDTNLNAPSENSGVLAPTDRADTAHISPNPETISWEMTAEHYQTPSIGLSQNFLPGNPSWTAYPELAAASGIPHMLSHDSPGAGASPDQAMTLLDKDKLQQRGIPTSQALDISHPAPTFLSRAIQPGVLGFGTIAKRIGPDQATPVLAELLSQPSQINEASDPHLAPYLSSDWRIPELTPINVDVKLENLSPTTPEIPSPVPQVPVLEPGVQGFAGLPGGAPVPVDVPGFRARSSGVWFAGIPTYCAGFIAVPSSGPPGGAPGDSSGDRQGFYCCRKVAIDFLQWEIWAVSRPNRHQLLDQLLYY
eukprot:jgi/Botrbrau1/1963/Bobra.0052s0006.1